MDKLNSTDKLAGVLGIDTGGTFTDFYWFDGDEARIHKVLSTPESPEQAIVQGIEELGLVDLMQQSSIAIVHGSTVATNAALEGKGVRTVYITNKGFADMLTLGRQNRLNIYALQPKPVAPPVAEHLCIEVDCRRDSNGEIIRSLKASDITSILTQLEKLKPQAVAINLLYSYLAADDEQAIAAALPKDLFVSCSHKVLPEYKEYERGMATWLNAWLGPKVADYLSRLSHAVAPCPLGVMQSSGGTINAVQAGQKAVNLLLSGPAGGLAGAKFVGEQIGSTRLITFDMGGTSTDVALIDQDIQLTSEGRLGSYCVAVPMVDMHTIGAGGGSIAYVDIGGMLHVGPESAGAKPGPACYGQGGYQATVTDANAVLGRLRPEYFLGGRMSLDVVAAESSIHTLAEGMGVSDQAAAIGVLALANEHMAAALREISVQRGYNPSEFELCCFGGAGGLHVCALAEELNMSRILVPSNGGVLSAFGMLVAPRSRQLSKSILRSLTAVDTLALKRAAQELITKGHAELTAEGSLTEYNAQVTLDCRYIGQSSCLSVLWHEDLSLLERQFNQAHKSQFGHCLNLAVEVVNVRVKVEGPALIAPRVNVTKKEPSTWLDKLALPVLGEVTVWARDNIAESQVIDGPAIICEMVSTTLVAQGWQASSDEHGNLRLVKQAMAS